MAKIDLRLRAKRRLILRLCQGDEFDSWTKLFPNVTWSRLMIFSWSRTDFSYTRSGQSWRVTQRAGHHPSVGLTRTPWPLPVFLILFMDPKKRPQVWRASTRRFLNAGYLHDDNTRCAFPSSILTSLPVVAQTTASKRRLLSPLVDFVCRALIANLIKVWQKFSCFLLSDWKIIIKSSTSIEPFFAVCAHFPAGPVFVQTRTDQKVAKFPISVSRNLDACTQLQAGQQPMHGGRRRLV